MCWFIGYGKNGANLDYVDVSIANRDHHNIHNASGALVDVEDSADGLIAFKNGIKASFWCMNYYSFDDQVEITLDCEYGYVKITAEEAVVTLYDGRTFSAKPDPNDTFDYGGGPSYWGASHAKQIDDFYAALEDGEEPEISGKLIYATTHCIMHPSRPEQASCLKHTNGGTPSSCPPTNGSSRIANAANRASPVKASQETTAEFTARTSIRAVAKSSPGVNPLN